MTEYAESSASEYRVARAEWALDALDSFALNMGSGGDWVEDLGVGELDEENLSATGADLICSLLHLARLSGLDAEGLIERGKSYFWSDLTEDKERDQERGIEDLHSRGIAEIEKFLMGGNK